MAKEMLWKQKCITLWEFFWVGEFIIPMPWEELKNAWFAPQYTLTFLKETKFYLSVRGRTWWFLPQKEGKIPENWYLNKDLEWTKRILTLAFTAFIRKRKIYSHCWSSLWAALLFTFFQKKLWKRDLKQRFWIPTVLAEMPPQTMVVTRNPSRSN